MTLKIRLKGFIGKLTWSSLLVRAALATVVLICDRHLFMSVLTTSTSISTSWMTRLKQPLFANTAKIFAAPREVTAGTKAKPRI